MNPKKTYFLVTGQMRSGTTFTCNLLNSQSEVQCFSDYPTYLLNEAKKLGILEMTKKLSEVQKNVLISYIKSEVLQKAEVDNDELEFDFSDSETLLDLYKMSLDIINDGRPIVGSKKTNQFNYLPDLLESGTKIIYVYRDPRDIIISSKHRFSSFNIYQQTFDLIKGVEMAQSLSRQYSSDLYMLKFEDLILFPEKVVPELEQFLGTTINHKLSQFKFRNTEGKQYQNNSSFDDLSKLFDKNAVFRWKEKKDKEKLCIQFVSAVMSDFLADFGYEAYPMEKRKSKKIVKDYNNYFLKKRIKVRVSHMLNIILSRLFKTNY